MFKKSKLKYLLLLSISLVIIFASFYFKNELARLGSFGLIGIFLINFFSTVTLFLPNFSAVTVVAGGSVYNPILVAIVATLGGALGDSSSYVVGRSGREVFVKEEGRYFKIIYNVFNETGFIIIFLLALIPNPVFDAFGIIAGGLKYSFKRYFLAMLLGRFLRNLLLAYLGKAL